MLRHNATFLPAPSVGSGRGFDTLRGAGSTVLADLLVCGFSARSAEKPHT
jgi:hypothetical protein